MLMLSGCCSITVQGNLRPKPWCGNVVPLSKKIPSSTYEKLGIINGRPQRERLPVSAARYRTGHSPTWKWETRPISGITAIAVVPAVITCSRAIGKRVNSAITCSLHTLVHSAAGFALCVQLCVSTVVLALHTRCSGPVPLYWRTKTSARVAQVIFWIAHCGHSQARTIAFCLAHAYTVQY